MFVSIVCAKINKEYEVDKQLAVERILTCTQRELDHVRQAINDLHQQQRDALLKRVELEHQTNLTTLKKKQWVRISFECVL